MAGGTGRTHTGLYQVPGHDDAACDVARELGLRPDHVVTLLYRAKKELYRCLLR
jgi:hypothetical protein